MESNGKNIYDYTEVRLSLIGQNKFDLVDWLDNNREDYTTSILNREQHYIGFYHG